MCLFSRDIRNKSKFQHYRGYRQLISIKCGHCSECRKEKELEWQHRCYAEYINARRNGGYSLFFTMTYDEKHVPYIGRMRAFSKEHIVLFRKKLRNHITRYVRNGVQPFKDAFDNDQLHLIITSEYGGRTFRPHYHGLIFVSSRRLTPDMSFTKEYLDPYMLSNFLKECWQHGHVTIGSGSVHSGLVNSQGAIDYVSKYMYKDDDFTERVEQRRVLHDYILTTHPKSLLFDNFLDYEESVASYPDFLEYQHKVAPYLPDMDFDTYDFAISSPKSFTISPEVYKQVKPFHVQSEHFGLCVIDNLGRDEILKNNCLWMPDKERGVSQIPIPMYIQKHLFYNKLDVSDHYKFCDGKKHYRYVLTEEGIQHKLNHLDESIVKFESNIKKKIEAKKSRTANNDNNQRYVQLFNLLNDSEQLHNFAIYLYIYRGNGIDKNCVNYYDAYRYLLHSSYGFYQPETGSIWTEELIGDMVSTSFFKKSKSGYYFYDHVLRKQMHDNIDQYVNKEFEEYYSLLTDEELLKHDVSVNDYYRKVRRAKARQKLISEQHLFNPLHINQIKVS